LVLTHGTPNICMVAQNNSIIQFLCDFVRCIAITVEINICCAGGMLWRVIPKYFQPDVMLAYFCLLFCLQPHHTTNMIYVPSFIDVF
jgi:hypothetical protein